MLFGDPRSFAVEVVPGPEAGLPRFVGRSLAGRMKVHLGSQAIGDFHEPCCVLGPAANHLIEIGQRSIDWWHESLCGLQEEEIFHKLNRACYLGQDDPYPPVFGEMNFLTNVSECFDRVKGFALRPDPGVLLLLVQVDSVPPILFHRVSMADWVSVSSAFLSWLVAEEQAGACGTT
jgi:hypothetical protein